jgi:aminopeptidase N
VDYEIKDLYKLLNSNNYPKGAWVLHMLRGLLGDEIFFYGISKYYSKYKNKTVLTDDFMRTMEEASGKNLQYFFDQWIFSPGYPIIEFDQNWIPKNNGNGKMIITINQTQKKKWPTFIFESKICWDNNKCIPVKVDQKTQSFEITTLIEPDSIYIDPENWILMDIQN